MEIHVSVILIFSFFQVFNYDFVISIHLFYQIHSLKHGNWRRQKLVHTNKMNNIA